MKAKTIIILACIVILGGFYIAKDSGSKEVEDTQYYEPAVFENSTINIDKIDVSKDNKQTFTILLENTSNTPISVIEYNFKIESNGNIYRWEDFSAADQRINPHMNTTIELDFKMPLSALTEADSKLIIKNLYYTKEQSISLHE